MSTHPDQDDDMVEPPRRRRLPFTNTPNESNAIKRDASATHSRLGSCHTMPASQVWNSPGPPPSWPIDLKRLPSFPNTRIRAACASATYTLPNGSAAREAGRSKKTGDGPASTFPISVSTTSRSIRGSAAAARSGLDTTTRPPSSVSTVTLECPSGFPTEQAPTAATRIASAQHPSVPGRSACSSGQRFTTPQRFTATSEYSSSHPTTPPGQSRPERGRLLDAR